MPSDLDQHQCQGSSYRTPLVLGAGLSECYRGMTDFGPIGFEATVDVTAAIAASNFRDWAPTVRRVVATGERAPHRSSAGAHPMPPGSEIED